MSDMATPALPGWYNDPEGVRPHQAYWDGEKWTGAIRRETDQPTRKNRAWMWVVFGIVAVAVCYLGLLVVALRWLTSGGFYSY